ncbi:MATE family efflux transporter [Acinetobacter baumannii]|uniref:MATE family efflux transporter n=4 Tax=Acinetobacter baumannii TaxID=470 RepID=UPI00135F3DD5|nr:MATE family efflux transporter [Acinetobacter baumannii]ELB1534004.1 MATE family efflux transporter [Acinetobacter baumannii]CAA0247904.1 hypothetical protein AB901B6_02605 [Acinetobacter baumannii]
MIDIKDFYKTFFFILLTFITSRLQMQTDIIMLTHLGSSEVASFVIPSKFMIIDTIIAFALAPIVSVTISSKKDDILERNKLIRSFLGFTLFLSLVLMFFGFWFYPLLIHNFVDGVVVRELALDGIFWLNLSIPVRMLVFIATMSLYATESKNKIWYVYIFALMANIFFNWLFIFYFEYGFRGVYISTLIVYSIELFWMLYLVSKETRNYPISRFKFSILKDIIQKMYAEGSRLASAQFGGFLLIAILSSKDKFISILTAFSVISLFHDLLLMPFIALMRSSAMKIAEIENKDISGAYRLVIHIVPSVIVIAAFIGGGVALMYHYIGHDIYYLASNSLSWWHTFAIMMGISLPIYAYGYLLRSSFQACGAFQYISKLEMSTLWMISLPLKIYAIYMNNSFLFFLSSILVEIIIILFLIKKLKLSYHLIPD